MKLLLFVIACALVGTAQAIFGATNPEVSVKTEAGSIVKRFIPPDISTILKLQKAKAIANGATPGTSRVKRQFFGNQNAGSIQNNQFSSNSGMGSSGDFTDGNGNGFGSGSGSGFGGGFGGAQASVHSGSTVMRAGSFRQKRQFFGNQNAENIQNNQFSGNSGMGGGMGGAGAFTGGSGAFTGGMGNGFGGGFGGAQASVHSGSTVMRAGSFRNRRFVPQHALNKLMFGDFKESKDVQRPKRQFFGDQNANSIQNNQFSG